jgi:Peptide methionine sulfoxide reductase
VAAGLLTLVALATAKVISNGKEGHPVGGVEQSAPSNAGASVSLEKATFGAGCFWCTETMFQRLKGVKSVVVHFRINCGVTFDASQLIRAISWPKARASSQQSDRLRVADTSPLSLTIPGRSCESSAASVPESRARKISLARG